MRSSALVLCLLLFVVLPASAVVIHVPADQSTIARGIAAAQSGDTVLVACGTYPEHDLVMRSGVCLRAESGSCVTIDAGRAGRAILCQAVDAVVIEGFTVTGGNASGADWQSGCGGGILISDCSPLIRDCVFAGNEAHGGGGGMYLLRSTARTERCVFRDGSAVDGAGVYVNHASPEFEDCLFTANESLVWGGGVFCENYSSPIFRGCTLAGNSAAEGAGIWCVWYCYPQMENSIVAFSSRGEGVFVYDNPSGPSMVSLACCDVFGNHAGDYGGVIPDQTGLNGNISDNPCFCDLPGGDYTVSSGSPCLPENNSCGVLIGALGQGCVTTAVPEAAVPGSLRAFPNPSSGPTGIAFTAPAAGQGILRIFDPAGREVRSIRQSFAAGPQVVGWDGRDASGRSLPSGTYLCRLETAGGVQVARVSLVR